MNTITSPEGFTYSIKHITTVGPVEKWNHLYEYSIHLIDREHAVDFQFKGTDDETSKQQADKHRAETIRLMNL